MTSHGVLWRTCKAILKPVYRNLTCRGDVTCDVNRPSRVASSCWPMYNHKVTFLTSIPIFIQLAVSTSYFQHISISKVTPIIVHLLSIHSYENTLKYMSYSLSIPANNLKTDPGRWHQSDIDQNQISIFITYQQKHSYNKFKWTAQASANMAVCQRITR